MFELIKVIRTVDRRKAGARTISYADDGSPQTALRMVLPSEYARARVALGPVCDLVRSTSLEAITESGNALQSAVDSDVECIDLWNIVRARERFDGLSVNEITSDSFPYIAEIGDEDPVRVIGCSLIEDPLQISFAAEAKDDGYVITFLGKMMQTAAPPLLD